MNLVLSQLRSGATGYWGQSAMQISGGVDWGAKLGATRFWWHEAHAGFDDNRAMQFEVCAGIQRFMLASDGLWVNDWGNANKICQADGSDNLPLLPSPHFSNTTWWACIGQWFKNRLLAMRLVITSSMHACSCACNVWLCAYLVFIAGNTVKCNSVTQNLVELACRD